MTSGTRPAITPPEADATEQVVSFYASQKKIYPRAVTGWFIRWRWALVWLTQLVFYVTPWLTWNGRQVVLFDLLARRFYVFGLVLYPQDFIYLAALLMVSAYSLFLFTAIGGRLWCGYACPQTVYTEIFMWIERKFEGDRAARMRLDGSGWTLERAWRKAGKQVAWVAIALWTGFTFVGYFTPIHKLVGEAQALSFGPWETFWVFFYGFATYLFAGTMREQVCKYMCPYARFQSAMLDRDTLIITYDAQRGEPRGSRSRKADPKALGLGECIDCNLCVQVCPTGIDIRKGLQYECIGCAACVDVCNDVMKKMNYPTGLVRYDTENGIEGRLSRGQLLRRTLRPRIVVYSLILVAICTALGSSIALRPPFRVDVVRDRASMARVVEQGSVENVYRIQVMNATEKAQHYTVGVDGLPGLKLRAPVSFDIEPTQSRWVALALQVPAETAEKIAPGAHPVFVTVVRTAEPGQDERAQREKSSFILPR